MIRRNALAVLPILAGLATPAAAGGELRAGPAGQGNGPVVLAQAASEGHVQRREENRDARNCNRAVAENKARRMGVRNAHTYFMSPNVVRVRGVRKGERVRLAFANAPYCPYLGG